MMHSISLSFLIIGEQSPRWPCLESDLPVELFFGVGGSGRSPVEYLEEEGDRGNRALSPSGQRIHFESDGPGRHFATLPIHVAPSLCAIS